MPLTGELGKKLTELLDEWKSVGPELAAARTLDAVLREKDGAKAIAAFKTTWPALKTTKLGDAVAKKAREQFLVRGEQAWAGKAGLEAAIHGKVKIDPARAHPGAGLGGVGIEIDYDFEKDAEANDFDPAGLSRAFASGLPGARGGVTLTPLIVNQSRLTSDKANGGALPLEFGGDLEVTFEGGLREDTQGGKLGAETLGFAATDGSVVAQLVNGSALNVYLDGKLGPNAEKKYGEKELRPGMQCSVSLKLAGGKLVFGRNDDTIQPLNCAPKAPLRIYLAMIGQPDWFIEHLLIKGTATKSSLDGLARAIAEKEAKALFNGE